MPKRFCVIVGALLAIAMAETISRAADAQAPQGFDQQRDVPHGKVERVEYDSKTLGFKRVMTVCLPSDYGKAVTKYPVLYLLHGKVERVEYDSKTLGFKRVMTMYLPSDYGKAGTKYPVLYLLHGSGDDETGWNMKGSAK